MEFVLSQTTDELEVSEPGNGRQADCLAREKNLDENFGILEKWENLTNSHTAASS